MASIRRFSFSVKKIKIVKEKTKAMAERDMGTTEYLTCKLCGEPLTEDNCFERAEGISDYCISCEEKQFKSFENINGLHFAIFYMCIKMNVPCEPLLITRDFYNKPNKWEEYNRVLIENNKILKADNSYRTFFDGVSDIRKIFGKALTEDNFVKYCQYEKERIASLPGTEEQRQRWGVEPIWKGVPLTDELYEELDRQYYNRCASYKGVTLSPQAEDTLVKVSKLNVVMDILMSIGEAKMLFEIQKTVDSLMTAEQLRKKDEKPIETMQIDTMVEALEKSGCMQNGKLLNYNDLLNVFEKRFFKSKKGKYSVDAVHQMIYDYYNTARSNADLATVTILPDDLKIEDTYEEFEPEETEDEKKKKRFANLTPIQFESDTTPKPKTRGRPPKENK